MIQGGYYVTCRLPPRPISWSCCRIVARLNSYQLSVNLLSVLTYRLLRQKIGEHTIKLPHSFLGQLGANSWPR